MKIFFCGGAEEVGASCVLVKVSGKNILFDCGMRMKKEPFPDLQTIKNAGRLDAIILSHAHMDHSGCLPVICSEYPEIPVYMTHPTLALVKVLLYDSLKIMDMEEEIPKYSRKQVELMLENTVGCSFNNEINILGDSIKIVFFPAGHILGAASIYIETDEGSIFYSGDISLADQRTISGFSIPRLKPDVCILESTYGNRLHSDRKLEEKRLVDTVGKMLLQDGKVLIPAFAVGRAQEVILILKSAINKGVLPPEAKVYVDGMVRQICNIYFSFPNYLRASLAKKIWRGNDVFFSDNIIPVNSNEQRNKLIQKKGPFCIISSSGMLSGGPSALYAEKFAGDENAFIAVTGYQDEESPGRGLQEFCNSDDNEKLWKINKKQVRFNCETGTYTLSAHADKNELINLVEYLKPKEVFLVHGDQKTINFLGNDMQLRCKTFVHAPSVGSSYKFEKMYGKRVLRKIPQSLSMNNFPTKENMQKLSEYLILKKSEGPWTSAELLKIWGIRDINDELEKQMTDLLNTTASFEYDRKRLFMFYPVKKLCDNREKNIRMEVNQMLGRAAVLFPAGTGLYKKGAKIETGTALLSFRFPSVAKEKYSRHFEVFEKETGWKVELNNQPDTSFIKPVLTKLLKEENISIGRLSCFLDKKQVKVNLTAIPDDIDNLCNEFYNLTHLNLVIITPHSVEQKENTKEELPGGSPVHSNNSYSREDAVNMTRDIFEPSEVKVYKYSIKSDALGDYIELQFLTPILGQKYNKWIDDIKEITGWRIAVSPNPRQQELIELARELIMNNNQAIIKGPSIYSADNVVKAKVGAEMPENIVSSLNKVYKDKTGYELIILV